MMAARRVTDRAQRYRANKLLPVKGKCCLLCGSTRNLVPDHWDGHPDHTNPANLEVLCKSCNTSKGAAFAKAGRGRLTHQYNPTKGGGAANIGEWMQAVGAITPHVDRGDRGLVSEMNVRAAVDMIRATPQSKRRDYAARLRHNPSWREVLFGKPYKPVDVGSSYPAPRAPRVKPTKATAKRADYWGGSGEWPSERVFQEGFKRGMTAREIIAANPAVMGTLTREKLGRAILKKMDALQKRWKAASAAGRSTADIERKLQQLDAEVKALMKRNPATASAEVFEDFHGFEPSEVVTVTKKIHHHAHLASLGLLVYFQVWGIDKVGHTLNGFKKAILASNEDRNQLFIEGGDQRIDLADFGIRQSHELETLGKVLTVAYSTDKKHLGEEGGKAVYVHDFTTTNENGKHVKVPEARLPQLIYDVRNEQLLMSGGSYEILREGIDK
jgi:hypothetical protein